MNIIEWDKKHRHTLIRLTGSEESQEKRLHKMIASEAMYEALKNTNKVLEFIRDKGGFHDGSIGKLECNRAIAVNNEALAKAEGK